MRFEAALLGISLLASSAMAQDMAPAPAAPVLNADGTLDVKVLPATGKPRQCLPLRDVQQTRSVGKDVILFRTGANRWHRNARVQARALRNGQIFHAQGPMRWGRDVALKLLGEQLLDMPWLYGYRQQP